MIGYTQVCNDSITYAFQSQNINFIDAMTEYPVFNATKLKSNYTITSPSWTNIFIIYPIGRSWFARTANVQYGQAKLAVI